MSDWQCLEKVSDGHSSPNRPSGAVLTFELAVMIKCQAHAGAVLCSACHNADIRKRAQRAQCLPPEAKSCKLLECVQQPCDCIGRDVY